MKITFIFLFLVIGINTCVSAAVLKVATLAPDGTVWMKEIRRSAEVIKKQTENRVKLKFYPGGIMGNEKSVLRKIRLGQLHGGAFTSGGLLNISPKNQVYGLPLKFRTYEEMDHIRSKFDSLIINNIEKKGFVTFGLAEGGFTYLMSKEPIESLSDLKGQKMWIPEGDLISKTIMDVAGLSPISLPLTDVLTGLQTGLINSVASTPSFAIALQWHSKVKYLTQYPIVYSIGAFVLTKKAFNRLKKEDQQVVHDNLEDVFKRLNQLNRVDNTKALQALSKQGIQFIQPGPDAISELVSVSEQASSTLVKQGHYTEEVVNAVEKHLSAFRESSTSK